MYVKVTFIYLRTVNKKQEAQQFQFSRLVGFVVTMFLITLCLKKSHKSIIFKFSKCEMLEQRSMDICNRKIGKIDVTEVQAAGYLYTNIFLFRFVFIFKMQNNSIREQLQILKIDIYYLTIIYVQSRKSSVLYLQKNCLVAYEENSTSSEKKTNQVTVSCANEIIIKIN